MKMNNLCYRSWSNKCPVNCWRWLFSTGYDVSLTHLRSFISHLWIYSFFVKKCQIFVCIVVLFDLVVIKVKVLLYHYFMLLYRMLRYWLGQL